MGVKKRWLFAILAGISLLSLLPGCAGEKATPTETEPPGTTPIPSIPPIPPIPVDEVSLEEAERIVGAPVAPKYLPAGYEFRRGFVYYQPAPHLNLYFSDEEMPGEVKTVQDFASLTHKKFILNVDQVAEMPSSDIHEGMAGQHGGKVVDINETKGWLLVEAGGGQLIWFQPGLLLDLSIVNPIPEQELELVKIAESIG
ncbi:MAG: hypothetical protein JW732_07060 [Dehalococcoidia bacterium]|nr:hypothetical protein [Dehalococcoidia bacterium]